MREIQAEYLRDKDGKQYCLPAYRQPGFPDQCHSMKLEQIIGGLSAAISAYDWSLSPQGGFGISSLAIAAYEGRDIVAETKEKRDDCILARVLAAEELDKRGVSVKSLRRFQWRLSHLDASEYPKPPLIRDEDMARDFW